MSTAAVTVATPTRDPASHRIVTLAVVGLLVAGTLLAASGPMSPALRPLPVPWPLLLAGFLVGEIAMIRLHFRSEAHEFNLIDVPLVIATLAVSPLMAASAAVTAVLVTRIVRRQTPLKALFNVALGALEATITIAVAHLCIPAGAALGLQLWAVMLLAVIAATTVSALMVHAAISMTQGQQGMTDTLTELMPSVSISAGTVSLTLAGLLVLTTDPVATLLLLAPLVVVFIGHRAYIAKLAESGRLQFIARFTTAMATARGTDLSLRMMLTMVAQEMGAGTVSVIALADTATREGQTPLWGRLTDGRFTHGTDLSRLDLGVTRHAMRDAAGGIIINDIDIDHPAAICLARAGLDDAILVPLIDEDGPFGLLMVGNRTGDVTSWVDHDRELAIAVARHTSAIVRTMALQSSVTDLTEERCRLLHESLHDPLTGLVNRRGLHRAMSTMRGRFSDGAHMALLYVDLNGFKAINDGHGHAAGDAVLAAVGARLAGLARAHDIVARLGGDEFAVVLAPSPGAEATEVIAERVRRMIEGPVEINGTTIQPSAAVGAATGSMNAGLDALLVAADRNMYAAKSGAAQPRPTRALLARDVVVPTSV